MNGPIVSIVVPAFNEAELIEQSLVAIVAYCERSALAHELIVVDDGSIDGTRSIAQRFAATRPDVRVVGLDTNVGLGGALRAGFARCHAPIVVTMDADLTYEPDHIGRLVSACTPSTAIVIASPYAEGGRVSGVPQHRLVMSKWANRILRRRTGLATSTAMVRAYDRGFLVAALDGVDDRDLSLGLLRAARDAGRTIVEVPAHLDWTRVPDRRSRLRARDTVAAVLRALRSDRANP